MVNMHVLKCRVCFEQNEKHAVAQGRDDRSKGGRGLAEWQGPWLPPQFY
jgi:hypothetical protein